MPDIVEDLSNTANLGTTGSYGRGHDRAKATQLRHSGKTDPFLLEAMIRHPELVQTAKTGSQKAKHELIEEANYLRESGWMPPPELDDDRRTPPRPLPSPSSAPPAAPPPSIEHSKPVSHPFSVAELYTGYRKFVRTGNICYLEDIVKKVLTTFGTRSFTDGKKDKRMFRTFLFLIGVSYHHGQFGKRRDPVEAEKYYLHADARGSTEAKLALIELFMAKSSSMEKC